MEKRSRQYGCLWAIEASHPWLRNKYPLMMQVTHDPRRPSTLFNVMLIAWVVSNVSVYSYVIAVDQSLFWLLPIFHVWSVLIVVYLLRQRNQLRDVGIKGADRQIRKGIDYYKALTLCHNQLEFLGVDAARLTRENEFEKAIRRCRKDEPVKLLLFKPTERELIRAARRLGKDNRIFPR